MRSTRAACIDRYVWDVRQRQHTVSTRLLFAVQLVPLFLFHSLGLAVFARPFHEVANGAPVLTCGGPVGRVLGKSVGVGGDDGVHFGRTRVAPGVVRGGDVSLSPSAGERIERLVQQPFKRIRRGLQRRRRFQVSEAVRALTDRGVNGEVVQVVLVDEINHSPIRDPYISPILSVVSRARSQCNSETRTLHWSVGEQDTVSTLM
mmetsp:Transcript_30546/g.63113  ORF Transcript_30546/g.63113 Transcript_30546/m.63113 type:complete len:204 (+) Transcript_30546:848-1459(+)